MQESKQTTELVEAIISGIVLTHEIAADIGEYIDCLTPKVKFAAAEAVKARPSTNDRRQVRTYEREILRSINSFKYIVSGLQYQELGEIDALTEADLVTHLSVLIKPLPQLEELKNLVTDLKARNLDVFDAESLCSLFHSVYKLFADTLNDQINHYNSTYNGSLPLVGTLP